MSWNFKITYTRHNGTQYSEVVKCRSKSHRLIEVFLARTRLHFEEMFGRQPWIDYRIDWEPESVGIDLEIARVDAAMKRVEDKLDEMQDYWARNHLPCCPGCAFGHEYTELADKVERQAAWLVVLLHRRSKPEDPKRIRQLTNEYHQAHVMEQHLEELRRKKELSKMNKEKTDA